MSDQPHTRTELSRLPDGLAPISRADVVDAASRVIARSGDHRMRWAAIAYEAGQRSGGPGVAAGSKTSPSS